MVEDRAFNDGLRLESGYSLINLMRYERQLVAKNAGNIIKRTVEKAPRFWRWLLLSLIKCSQWVRRTVKKLAPGFQETAGKRGYFHLRILVYDFLDCWLPVVDFVMSKNKVVAYTYNIIYFK